jgi:hypothetical protein
MIKKYWWIGLIVVILAIGLGVYLCLPRYKIIQADRSLTWGNQPSNFIMSPAKIEITNLHWGFPLTIPVKITNSAGDMQYTVRLEAPAVFDKGYISADGNRNYTYSWDKDSVIVSNNTSEVIKIKVKKNSLFGKTGIEKGIAISQSPAGNQINIGFSYVFEILIGGIK